MRCLPRKFSVDSAYSRVNHQKCSWASRGAQIAKFSERFLASARPCENSLEPLRLSSGRADKYLDSNEAIPFVVSAVEP